MIAMCFEMPKQKGEVKKKNKKCEMLKNKTGLSQIFKIPSKKVSLNEAELAEEEIMEFFVDATEQQIERPKKGQKRYYSGKKKKHTLKNQIVTDKKGKILAVTKSVHGKKHDKKLFDETRPILPPKSNLTGDLGYYGADGITLPNKKTQRQRVDKRGKTI